MMRNSISDFIGNTPSYIFLFLLASTAIIVGIEWDISWHETIGRDKLLSPPHVVVYIGGIICGLTCAYMALRQTFVDENLYNKSGDNAPALAIIDLTPSFNQVVIWSSKPVTLPV